MTRIDRSLLAYALAAAIRNTPKALLTEVPMPTGYEAPPVEPNCEQHSRRMKTYQAPRFKQPKRSQPRKR